MESSNQVLLWIYLLVINNLFSLFIASCWCMIDCLWNSETIKDFIIFGRLSPRIQNHLTYKFRGKWQYLSVLVLKILRTLMFPREDRGLAGRVARDPADSTIIYLLLLYIYAEFIHVYRIDTPSFQSWNLRNSPPPSNVVYDLSSLRRHRWSTKFILCWRFYKIAAAWRRKTNFTLFHSLITLPPKNSSAQGQ